MKNIKILSMSKSQSFLDGEDIDKILMSFCILIFKQLHEDFC